MQLRGIRPVPTFVAIVWTATSLFLLLVFGLGLSPSTAGALQLPVVVLPSIAAFGCAFFFYGTAGTDELMRRLRHLGGSPLPYLLGLTLFPVCAWISRWATSAFWHDVEFHASVSDWRIGIASAIPLCLFPGFAEEFGWRGFLQPHLQQRWNPALSSAVVGIVWWLWHGLSIGVEPQKYAGWGFLLFGAYIVPTSVLIGSIVERAGGSLPVAIVAHFGANIVNFYIPMSDTSWMVYFGSLWLGAVSIGIAAARRARRKSDHDPWPCNTEISGSFDSSRPDA